MKNIKGFTLERTLLVVVVLPGILVMVSIFLLTVAGYMIRPPEALRDAVKVEIYRSTAGKESTFSVSYWVEGMSLDGDGKTLPISTFYTPSMSKFGLVLSASGDPDKEVWVRPEPTPKKKVESP